MTFVEAIRSCFSKYFDARGRAPRSEYWYFQLLYVAVFVLAAIVYAVTDGSVASALPVLVLYLPNITVTIRRLHDTSKSGWFILISLIPLIGPLLLLVLMIAGSHPDNEYGPCPIDLDAIRLDFEERFVVDDRPPGWNGPILDAHGDVVERREY